MIRTKTRKSLRDMTDEELHEYIGRMDRYRGYSRLLIVLGALMLMVISIAKALHVGD